MLLVSPAEPATVKRHIPVDAEWKHSTLCEQFGVDFLWHGHNGWCGVQRKELQDLLASAADGRLARELQQLVDLDIAVLVVEGKPEFTSEDVLIGSGYGRNWTWAQIQGLTWSVQDRGVWCAISPTTKLTVDYVCALQRWSVKERHDTALKRPGPVSVWGGRPDAKEFACHLLQGIPGVGSEMAARIYDHFGRVPWRWDVGEEELMRVEGVGAKRAKQMMAALRKADDI